MSQQRRMILGFAREFVHWSRQPPQCQPPRRRSCRRRDPQPYRSGLPDKFVQKRLGFGFAKQLDAPADSNQSRETFQRQ